VILSTSEGKSQEWLNPSIKVLSSIFFTKQ